jgi:hypothetical protein
MLDQWRGACQTRCAGAGMGMRRAQDVGISLALQAEALRDCDQMQP